VLAPYEVGELRDPIRVGFLLGIDAGDRVLGEPVATREVTERLVRGHNRPPGAVLQTRGELAVERAQLLRENVGTGGIDTRSRADRARR